MPRGRPPKREKALQLEHLIGWDSSFEAMMGSRLRKKAGRPQKHAIADSDLLAVVLELTVKGASESQALTFLANYLVQDARTRQIQRHTPELEQKPIQAWELAEQQLLADPEGSRRAVLAMKDVLKKRLPAARLRKK